jgi:hypothetical protein
MSTSSSKAHVSVGKHFSSSILLWMRTDRPRHAGMDHWKGPHSGIISATPGLDEYRQIHLAETNPGLWPSIDGVETRIPADRKADGVAEVTFQSALAPLKGRAQTKLAYKDEVNVFRRTLLYAGPPNTSRWYQVARPGQVVGARALVYLRRRNGVSGRRFRKAVNEGLVAALVDTDVLTELRTQVFLPWSRKTWDTPNVAHDNPPADRHHASVILGFADTAARAAFFQGGASRGLSPLLANVTSAIHAYDVTETLTYVKDGEIVAPAAG